MDITFQQDYYVSYTFSLVSDFVFEFQKNQFFDIVFLNNSTDFYCSSGDWYI